MKPTVKATPNENEKQRFVMVPVPDRFDELSSTGRLAWFALCSFTWAQNWDEERNRGECWPSLRKLAEVMGVTINTTKSGLRDLEEKEIIHIQRRRNGGRFTSTLYVLTPYANPQNDVSKSDVSKSDISKSDTGDVSNFDNGMYQILTQNNKKRIRNSEEEEGGAPAPDTLTNKERPTSPTREDRPETRPEARNGRTGDKVASSSENVHSFVAPNKIDSLFKAVWEQYREFNPQGEVEARRRFHRLLGRKTVRETERFIADLESRLNDALLRWMDGDEVNLRYVPKLSNWLVANYGG